MDKIVKLNHRLKRRSSRQTSVVRPSRADAEDAVRTLIRWAGDDPDREGLVGTPARVARAYEEWFAGYFEDPREYLRRTFEEVAGYDEIVLLRDIRFESHCEHHMAPIIGKAHVAYLPNRRVVGEQPVLAPGEAFEYRSGTPLATPSGIMVGTYEMETRGGEVFEVAIPAFSLDSPHQAVRLN